MRWFRSRSRVGSYLALFALAFQLAVSFAHVHLDDAVPPSAGAAAFVSPQSGDELNAPSTPTGHQDVADHLCPLCTLIHLAGALAPAETPPLPLPSMSGQLRLAAAVELGLAASHGVLFQARAPPIA
jgi:Protein of unknown function (DUF2946)